MATREKEFLYVGHYIDQDGNYILKIGVFLLTRYNFQGAQKRKTGFEQRGELARKHRDFGVLYSSSY